MVRWEGDGEQHQLLRRYLTRGQREEAKRERRDTDLWCDVAGGSSSVSFIPCRGHRIRTLANTQLVGQRPVEYRVALPGPRLDVYSESALHIGNDHPVHCRSNHGKSR